VRVKDGCIPSCLVCRKRAWSGRRSLRILRSETQPYSTSERLSLSRYRSSPRSAAGFDPDGAVHALPCIVGIALAGTVAAALLPVSVVHLCFLRPRLQPVACGHLFATAEHRACCGATHKDRPEVPAEWLKDEWRKRGLLKRFQLTVSGCVGPCDVPNVVEINSESGSQWLANITHFDQYRSLVEWAARSVEAGRLLDLPREFNSHLLLPWR
jgi:hypothetical protein